MKVTRMQLRRAPGLDKGLEELRFEAGLNVVFGPNESGKSTLARAIQSTLWPGGRAPGEQIDVESDWSEGEVSWSARHDGDTAWSRDGEACPAPPLPASENSPAYRLHLRDLIADEGEGHEDFARRVRAALDGGYDLTRRMMDQRSKRHGMNDKRALTAAVKELRDVEGRRADLARKVDDLGVLETEKRAADAARQEAALLERVLAWQAATESLDTARIAHDGDTTPDLLGHEYDELVGLDEALASYVTERVGLCEALDTLRGELGQLALPATPPAAHQMEAWLDDATALADLERMGHEADAAVPMAEEAEHRARATLRGGDSADANETDAPLFSPTPEEIDALADWLERRSRHADQRHVLEARRDRLEREAEPTAEEHVDEEKLLRARAVVGDHLRAGPGLGAPLIGAALSGASAAVAVGAGVVSPEALRALGAGADAGLGAGAALAVAATIVGGGVGLLAGRWLTRRRLESRLAALDVGVAAESAERLFDDLDARHRAARGEAERARECEGLEADLCDLEASAPELDALRQQLVERLGLDPGLSDLSVAEWARRIHAHREAMGALAQARAKRDGLEATLAETRGALFVAISSFVAPRPESVAEATRGIAALQARIASATHTRGSIERLETDLVRADERQGDAERKRASLLERFDLRALDSASAAEKLRIWIDALPEKQAKRKKVEQAEAVVEAARSELEGHGDLVTLDAFEVGQRLERARATAERADELAGEIGGIEREVAIAEGEDRVEVALAKREAAYAAVEQRRMEVFEGVAARLLVDDVSEQIGTRQRPEVLTRATGLFGLFTRHRYELEVEHDGDAARFVARATESQEKKKLSQLSDGTRMQLLLAARLAFVHDGERGVQPPLVLDEALSSSDATRMAAMTDALVAESSTGRQIFYMTNDPGDVADWEAACRRADAPAPHVVRLGERQRDEQAAVWSDFEPPPLRAPLPPPGDLDAAGYAALLGVPLPDPWAELGGLHVFHLLADDLEQVRRVLDELHVERLGHFESRRRSGVAEQLLGTELVDRIVFRAKVAERFFAAWRRGRGRALRAGDLDACDALTETFKSRLDEVARDAHGDARALMETIAEKRDERVKGLAEKRRAGLEEYLLERDFLSDDVVLDDDALATEVSAGLGEFVFGRDHDLARRRLREADALVRLWAALLSHGDDAA